MHSELHSSSDSSSICVQVPIELFHFHAQDLIRLRFGLMFEFGLMLLKELCSSSNSISFQFRDRVPIRVRFIFRARVTIYVRFGFAFGCHTRTRIGDCGFVAL